MTTKHEKILDFIKSLNLGQKISVRQVAKKLMVSEGTAYRAIKEAEAQGIVQTIERVGTVRIEKKERSDIERLTYAEVVKIVDGTVLGGRDGLHKSLQRFVIGAMKLEDMMPYVKTDHLLIVGNRDRVHLRSLEKGAAVLITGGFGTTEVVKDVADKKKLPVISTCYDTFTVAAMINRAIDDRLIKKEILTVEDIFDLKEEAHYLKINDVRSVYDQKVAETGVKRFPVVDVTHRVVGVVTPKDIKNRDSQDQIEYLMTKKPIVVFMKNSLASVAHEMTWQGVDMLPVVNMQGRLLGSIYRKNVMRALQYMQKQPQIAKRIHEMSWRGFEEVEKRQKSAVYRGKILPQMTDALGTLSIGVTTSLMTEAAVGLLSRMKYGNFTVQDFTLYLFKPVSLDSIIEIMPTLLEIGRIQARIDIEIKKSQQLVAKALLTAQVIEG